MFSSVLKSLCLCSLLATQPLMAAWSQPPETISEVSGSNTGIAVDHNGNATAVWAYHFEIQTAYKPFGGTWQTVETISPAGEDSSDPQIAYDPNGNAMVIWTYDDGINFTLKTAYKPSGGAWQTAEAFSPTGQYSFFPDIAFDPYGNAIAVWVDDDGISLTIQTSYKPSAGTWQTAETLSPPSEDSNTPQITFDTNGNAMAVWLTNVGGTQVIQAAYKPFGDNWQTADTISPSGEFSVEPQIAFDSNGNATAIWTYSGGSSSALKTAYKPFGGAWQTAEAFLQAPSESFFPQIAFDANNNATAMWMRFDISASIFAIQTSYKPSGGGWQTAETISPLNELSMFPQLAVDSNGNAIAIWIFYTPSTEIYILKSSTNIRQVPAPLPPCKFRGCLHKKKYAHKRPYHLKAKWTPSSSPNIKKYRIYKHSKIVRVVKPDSKLKFKTHLYWRSSTRKFKITSINTNNVESKRKRLKVKWER